MQTETQAYLLRLQRSEGSNHWRSSLENVHTGEVMRFANEQEMFRYLLKTLGQVNQLDDHTDHPPSV